MWIKFVDCGHTSFERNLKIKIPKHIEQLQRQIKNFLIFEQKTESSYSN